jgi:hypothetical protein
MSRSTRNQEGLTDTDHRELDEKFPEGMTAQQIVDFWTGRGERLTEATFRKYVQLGLLPRSTRVGRKGKQRGSLGLYPVSAIRQIDHLRRLMQQGFTIEQIQREFLFVRGDLASLERQVERVLGAFETALEQREADEMAMRSLAEARDLAAVLVEKLEGIERRVSLRARMARAVV